MQKIIIAKPYKFVPPHRGNWVPGLIQSLHIVDLFLNRVEGITSHEVRGIEHLRDSLRQGHGILLAPNHCRYADPLAMGWIARQAHVHLFAMASWHLFHQNWWQSFAMRMCGGFSVYREGVDRQSLDTAIDILVQASRPLVVFPEGTVFRTNDQLHPLLDGVAFLARSAARRRAKRDAGSVVIHPVGIKYVFRGDVAASMLPIIEAIETRFTWDATLVRQPHNGSLTGVRQRIYRLEEALLSLKEIQFFGKAQGGASAERRRKLIDHLLEEVEVKWLGAKQGGAMLSRIKQLRMKLVPRLIDPAAEDPASEIWRDLEKLYVAQQVSAYLPGYLDCLTDTRLLETLERIEEDITDKGSIHRPWHAILQVGEALQVDSEKPSKDAPDPIMEKLHDRLQGMLNALSHEARPLELGD